MANDFERHSSTVGGQTTLVGDAPIFLTGFARSGTTLVNRLMRDYFDAGFVNEGQFIVAFGKNIRRYGDLRVVRNQQKLIRDLSRDKFFSILSRNYHVDMDWDRVANSAASFAEIVRDILSQIAEHTGKRRIGSKYPVFGQHLDLLNSLFPDCRIVHVIRDGRDCALSQKNMTWGHQNTYSAALHWQAYIQAARLRAQSMGGRYLEIRYEDLLLDPETSMRSLEYFITGSDEHCITERFVKDKALLKTDKASRWRNSMSASSQAIFESVAGTALACCGYPLNGVIHAPSFLARVGYRAHNRLTQEAWGVARKLFKKIPERK